MTAKYARYTAFCLLLLLAAFYRAPLRAAFAPLGPAISNAAATIFPLLMTSGGSTASAGAVEMHAANIGGLTDSGMAMAGGLMTLTSGGTPAVVTFESAKSDLATAHCYPVPFKPSEGHTKITFTDLTRAARVKIYTISGELVRTLSKTDAGDSLDWDVKNTRGSAIDSGVYLFIIEGPSKPKKGKLMVIR